MRIFNRYYSIYDFILVIGDISLSWVAIAVVRAIMIFADATVIPDWTHWCLQSVAVTIIVVVSFYYCDLYAIDQTLSLREMLLRLITGIGISCVIIGVVSYPIPQLSKVFYASEMVLIAIGLCAWRVALMRVI